MIWFPTAIMKPQKHKNHMLIDFFNNLISAPFFSIQMTSCHMQCKVEVKSVGCDTPCVITHPASREVSTLLQFLLHKPIAGIADATLLVAHDDFVKVVCLGHHLPNSPCHGHSNSSYSANSMCRQWLSLLSHEEQTNLCTVCLL